MDADEARMIGWRVRQLRDARGKSLRVLAGLAKMSYTHLWRIERGEVALDSLSQIVALAEALEIAPSDLMRLPVPAPANGQTDSTIEAVRMALDAIEDDQPDGLALPVAMLADQVAQILTHRRGCRFAEVATALPGLIRNLHTTLVTGTDHDELLELAVHLHVHVTRMWLVHAAAPTDLLRRVVFLAQRLARERDEVTTLAVAGFGVADELLLAGAFTRGRAKLDSITLPPATAETAGLVASLMATHATAAVLDGRPNDAAAPMDAAVELAERFSTINEVDSLGFVYGPTNAGQERMWLALEADDPDQAIGIAQNVKPERHRFPVNRAYYWVHYGRALARVPGHRDDAVRAFRTAEDIFPTAVLRNSNVREVLAVLLPGARRDAIGRELRGMAYRAGLPV
ncbi:MAG: helix-turn-helix domain-containing protein [Pseudonocardiaceae bacterium]